MYAWEGIAVPMHSVSKAFIMVFIMYNYHITDPYMLLVINSNTFQLLFRDLPQDDGTDSKDSDISGPHSVDDESFLDVEEGEDDYLDKDINNNEVTSKDSLTSINTITNPAGNSYYIL